MAEPRIYQGGLTGTWWCATKWRARADGVMDAVEKHDVTDQIERIIAAALEQAGVQHIDGDDTELRAVFGEPVEGRDFTRIDGEAGT